MSVRQRIAVLTRLPEAGRTKTRLIPELGPEGAAEFHDRLARHEIGRAAGFCLGDEETTLTVWLAGGSAAEGRRWLGAPKLDCREQPEGDLGEKMRAAAERAFAEGAERVVVLGTDCPAVNEGVLDEAFAALKENEVVFGPAEDGGYYLVGLRRMAAGDGAEAKSLCHGIFEGIDWGTETVLADSVAKVEAAGASVGLLGELPDVDLPEDLEKARAELARGETVSVIIPVLNEAEGLPGLLQKLKGLEVIVADGDSTDATVEMALANGATVALCKERSRAAQMNAGAEMAGGEFLLFLHADTIPPEGFAEMILETLKSPDVVAGAFAFELEGDFRAAPLVESLVALRCHYFSTPYGDQGLFLRTSVFRKMGGFNETTGPEDLDLVDRLKKRGEVRVLPSPARTSARKWKEKGLVRVFFQHQLILGRFLVSKWKRRGI